MNFREAIDLTLSIAIFCVLHLIAVDYMPNAESYVISLFILVIAQIVISKKIANIHFEMKNNGNEEQ